MSFSPGTGIGWTDGDELEVDLSFLVGSNYTIIAVISRYGDTAPYGNYFMGTGNVNPSLNYGALHLGYYNDTDFRFSEFGNGVDAIVPANPAGTWQLALVTGQFSVNSGFYLYLGGSLVGTDADRTAMVSADQGAVGRAFLTTAGSTQFQGGLAEVLVFDVALTDADRQATEAYLRAKWGVQ